MDNEPNSEADVDVSADLEAITMYVLTELEHRLADGRGDYLAVSTAVGKAARRGLIQGLETASIALQEHFEAFLDEIRRARPDVTIRPWPGVRLRSPEGDLGPEEDPWLDEYGDEPIDD